MFSQKTQARWTRDGFFHKYHKKAELVNDVVEVQIMPEDDLDGLKGDIVASKTPAGHDHSMKSKDRRVGLSTRWKLSLEFAHERILSNHSEEPCG